MFREFINKNNVIIFDGAMGTSIQSADVEDKYWEGKNGCNEYLSVTYPELVEEIHRNYFMAGANVAVTNTFGAMASVLAEYGLEDRVAEINKAAVECAKRAKEGIDNTFISLSVGPGTKLATLGHTTYSALYDQYVEQISSVINDIDAVNIETCQDLLQVKAAVNAARDVADKAGKDLVINMSVTIEENGTLLTGTDISAVAALARGLNVDILGFNCAFGPDFMEKPISQLAKLWGGNLYLSANAGMPETVNGKTVYPMSADKFSEIVTNIVERYNVNIVGGCCGTTQEHIKKIARLKNTTVTKNTYDYKGEASSLYTSTQLIQEPAPALIGERANATGSKAFREVLLAEDYDKVVAICAQQEDEGAHFIDLSTAYAGRSEIEDYNKIVPMLNTSLRAPIVIDTTDTECIKSSLEKYAGKPIVNSINFEDGGAKLHNILKTVKAHPACVVALTIDEKGMAQTADTKYNIAKRIYDVWVNEYKFSPEDLIFDTLTFSVGSGDETLKTAAIETIDAIKLIKQNLKGAKTVLGVSNVSFGLSAKSRPILNSVFLGEAVKAGLDMAIVHASKLTSVSALDKADIDACMNLIYNKGDALTEFINHFENFEVSATKEDLSALTPSERLRNKIIKGDKSDMNALIDEVIKEIKAEDILNDILFPAMAHVGELFGSGKMLLPFVLQSAETMKTAVAILEPKFEKASGEKAGKVVIATVAGDVHDIGKNLVDIMMSNNGYEIHNLGIKVPVEDMIAKAREVNADAIGMSGLLVKSTHIMRDNIEKISKELPDVKIMLGGAALTAKFVEESCVPLMPGKVFHCRDAFDNIKVMKGDMLASQSRDKLVIDMMEEAIENQDINPIEREKNIPEKPFSGVKVLSNINVNDVFKYIDKKSLFSNAWGYKPKDGNMDEYDSMIKKVAEPEFRSLKESIIQANVVDAKVVYGYFNVRRAYRTLEVYGEGEYPKNVISFPKRRAKPHNTIADYFIGDEGEFDILPIQIVTLGDKCADYCKKLFKAGNFKDYFMVHGMFTELTEALAEYMHARIRRELKIDNQRGTRYSFGYPLAPDLEYNEVIAKLLSADKIGVEVSEIYEMVPEYTTSAFIVHHSKASY